jgi:hypothetical protein
MTLSSLFALLAFMPYPEARGLPTPVDTPLPSTVSIHKG